MIVLKLEIIFSSQCIFQKQMNEFNITTLRPQVDLFLFVLWKKLKTQKRNFKIYWPLENTKKTFESSIDDDFKVQRWHTWSIPSTLIQLQGVIGAPLPINRIFKKCNFRVSCPFIQRSLIQSSVFSLNSITYI